LQNPAGGSFALTSSSDTKIGVGAGDAFTATSSTYTAGDVLVDAGTNDADTLTVTATADISATPVVVGIETVNFNLNSTLASGDTTLTIALDNVNATNINVDVTADDSIVTDVALDNVKTGANVTLSSDFSTFAFDGVNNGSYTLNLSVAASGSVTGATVDDMTIVSTKDVTITASSNDGDFTASGEDVNLTVASATGAVNVTASKTVTITDADSADSVTVTAGDNVTITTADAATELTITSAGVVTVTSADSVETLNITTTGSEADAHNVLIADTNGATAATDVTIVSAGGIGNASGIGGANDAELNAATTLNLTVDESSVISAGGTDVEITLASTEADATDLVTYSLTAASLDTLAFAGSNSFTVSIAMDSIDGETVTNTNTGTSILAFNTEDTSAASDLSGVATSVLMRLDDTMDASDVLTVASTGAQFGLDDATAQANAFRFVSKVTTATGNSLNLVMTNSDGTTGDEVSDLDGALTVSHFATLNITANDSGLDATGVSIGGTTNNELTAINITGDEDVILNTVVGAAGAAINAGSFTGDLTVVIDNTANVVSTVTSGSGNDNFTLSGTLASAAAIVINSGAGTDDAIMTATNDLTYNGGSGVDTLSLSGTLDVSSNTITLTSVEQLSIEGTGAVTIAGSVVSGNTFIITSDAGADALTIKADSITTNLANLGFAAGFVAGTDTLAIDGSGISLAQTITGSSYAETITTGATGLGDTINAGGGADAINAGTGTNYITLSETTAAVDTVTYGGGYDNLIGFDYGGGAADDNVVLDISNIEALFGGTKNITELGHVDAGSAGDTANGDAVSFLTITGATDLNASTANILVANLSTNIASTSALETALEVGGALALTTPGDGSGTSDIEAGDVILVLYDNGTDSFLAAVHFTAAIDNTTITAGTLVAQNIVRFVGVADVTSIAAGDFGAFAS
jgi:hypothetical protein